MWLIFIIKLDKQGNILKIYFIWKWIYLVIVIGSGDIVYCYYGGNFVIVMCDDGQIFWVYKYLQLIGLVCVIVDFLDNIYVVGE